MSVLRVQFATKRRVRDTRVIGVPPISLLHRGVVGVQVEGRPLRNLPKKLRWGTDLRVDTHYLPAQLALLLDNFVRTHYIDGRQDFNCFTFMGYVTGLTKESHGIQRWMNYRFVLASPHEVVPYRPYIMVTSRTDAKLMHGVVGFSSSICLSVLGDNQALTLAPTADLMRMYGCSTIAEVISAHPMEG